jgi:predicted metal-dependent phosphoesterase TrpH
MNHIDMHCHTYFSKCSNIKPKDLIKTALKKQLSGILICDHDTIEGIKPVNDELKNRNYEKKEEFFILPGVEISTNIGEMIGAFIEEYPSTTIFPEVAEEIHEMGGITIAPHPFDSFRKKSIQLNFKTLRYIDAIEVFNSRVFNSNANKKSNKFATTNNKGISAGSDSHFTIEVGNAYISGQFDSSEDIRKKILLGDIEIYGKRFPIRTFIPMMVNKFNRLRHK